MFSLSAAADLFTHGSEMGVIHARQEEAAHKHIPGRTKQVSIRAAVLLLDSKTTVLWLAVLHPLTASCSVFPVFALV